MLQITEAFMVRIRDAARQAQQSGNEREEIAGMRGYFVATAGTQLVDGEVQMATVDIDGREYIVFAVSPQE